MRADTIPASVFLVGSGAGTEAWSAVEPLDLRTLYFAHAPFLRAAIQRLGGPRVDVEDLLHEVFLVALDRASDFEGRSSARTWLYGIAIRVVAGHRRRSKVRRFFGLEDVPPEREPTEVQTPASHLDAARARAQVFAILDKLAEKKRTVFILFELEGLSGEEIVRLVGAPLKTVWTRLFHARAEFKAHLARAEALDAALTLRPTPALPRGGR
jgi:RNA polymerase sigma-70 factor (ECF subfamily)